MSDIPELTSLEGRFRRITALSGAMSMLSWDHSTVMPPGGAEARAEQLATLSVLCHELLCEPRVADELDAVEARIDALDAWRVANVREMRRRWRGATSVPAELVDAAERARAACEMYWREARSRDDFAGTAPLLARVIELQREIATAKGEPLGLAPYDVMLDDHDAGLRDRDVEQLFAPMAHELPSLLERVLTAQASRPAPEPLAGPFPSEAQHALALQLMAGLGFDFDHGRLDTSHHPFTGGVPDDVRITTRWDEGDFSTGLMGVLHETGHALYEMGLPEAWRTQPVGEACSTTIHESQSLLIEMQACRTPEFLGFLAPRLCEAFGRSGPAWEVANLARHYHRVERSLIRVDADEVTYPLHIILRHRLERELIADRLKVSDLPAAWNEAMKELLGVVPATLHDGCMQDIHWYFGAFGYFPTYTLGALAAAQLFAAATHAEPTILPQLANGNFTPLRTWLREQVHTQGRLCSSSELVEAATGAPLSSDAFLSHLRARYLGET